MSKAPISASSGRVCVLRGVCGGRRLVGMVGRTMGRTIGSGGMRERYQSEQFNVTEPSHVAHMGRRASDPIVPPVIKLSEEEYVDLNTHMLRNRIIFIGERINDQVATKVVASLIALNTISPTEEIKVYINSAAGSSYAVVSILDTLRAIKAPVSTVAFGFVAGNCVQLLAAGTKGRRFSMPSTRIMLQQPNGGAQGSADEVNIQTEELNRTMRMMYRFLSESTGLPVDTVEEECDRENFLSAERAMELGIIDGVIGK